MGDQRKIGKRDKAEIETGADLLLYPGRGGIAVWVRRDELLPRSAIRWREPGKATGEIDLTEAVTMMAALQVGIAKTGMGLAKLFDIPEEKFAAMVDTAVEVLAGRMDAMTETRGGDSLLDKGDDDGAEGKG